MSNTPRLRSVPNPKTPRFTGAMKRQSSIPMCVAAAATYLSRIENGNANPTLNAIEVIANSLGLTVFELFDKE
jgi:transcriptional regulator with XRE-family HTH domain